MLLLIIDLAFKTTAFSFFGLPGHGKSRICLLTMNIMKLVVVGNHSVLFGRRNKALRNYPAVAICRRWAGIGCCTGRTGWMNTGPSVMGLFAGQTNKRYETYIIFSDCLPFSTSAHRMHVRWRGLTVWLLTETGQGQVNRKLLTTIIIIVKFIILMQPGCGLHWKLQQVRPHRPAPARGVYSTVLMLMWKH